MMHDNWISVSGSRLSRREDLERWLRSEWREAEMDYFQAGLPLGPGQRPVTLWIEFGTQTTVN